MKRLYNTPCVVSALANALFAYRVDRPNFMSINQYTDEAHLAPSNCPPTAKNL
ncbi:hypothetical protein NDI48_26715 [Microcoleus sp. AS-A8]